MCEHNPDAECFSCATERHAREHPELVTGCLTCKLSTIQVSQKVRGHRPGGPPPAGNRNSWENGLVRDHRGVPLLKANGSEITVKEYAQDRHKYDAARRKLANDPAPFGAA